MKELLKLLFEKQKIKVGHTFTDKAFIDTTLVPDLIRDFADTHKYNCLLKLHLPKGIKGAYVEFYHKNDHLNECEFLLPLNSIFVLKKKYFSLRYMKKVYECYLVAQE
ncbi:ADP-ribosyltransferase [Clostridium chromiireducens]|uniref:ADP-ribosyltransferase exoenzyme n=1 Tax=Clostridium chromiireducens TaxID=225345 RepID=A0A1V4IDW4_9CLOT|nr:ADP-ribosyltransferase [Clostridium chromiireducens]OPJ58151.1 ADP-ribosyltransferase exoenzyme [Clostridium chromiireducens]